MKGLGRVAVVAVVASIVAVAGCTPADDAPSPVSTSSPMSSEPTAATPSAPPFIGFPDLSAYVLDTSGRFEQVDRPRVQGFSFSTPDGLICSSNAYPVVEFEQVDCRGPLPHEGPGDWVIGAGRTGPATVESITGDPDLQADRSDPPPVLSPMHKLAAEKGTALCAVGEQGMTACRVGDHGFVLTPAATFLF